MSIHNSIAGYYAYSSLRSLRLCGEFFSVSSVATFFHSIFFCTLAHVSLNPTVLLNTRLPGLQSFESAQK
jgi:hypothetical protein